MSMESTNFSSEHKDHRDGGVGPNQVVALGAKVGQTTANIVVIVARTNKRIMLILVMKMY